MVDVVVTRVDEDEATVEVVVEDDVDDVNKVLFKSITLDDNDEDDDEEEDDDDDGKAEVANFLTDFCCCSCCCWCCAGENNAKVFNDGLVEDDFFDMTRFEVADDEDDDNNDMGDHKYKLSFLNNFDVPFGKFDNNVNDEVKDDDDLVDVLFNLLFEANSFTAFKVVE